MRSTTERHLPQTSSSSSKLIKSKGLVWSPRHFATMQTQFPNASTAADASNVSVCWNCDTKLVIRSTSFAICIRTSSSSQTSIKERQDFIHSVSTFLFLISSASESISRTISIHSSQTDDLNVDGTTRRNLISSLQAIDAQTSKNSGTTFMSVFSSTSIGPLIIAPSSSKISVNTFLHKVTVSSCT